MLRKALLKGLAGVSALAALAGALAQSTGAPGAGGSAASGPSAATTTDPAGAALGKGDRNIVLGMARANMAEIEAGKLAQGKSRNEQVKRFAQQMIDDHTKALNEVQALAKAKGVTLPAGLDAGRKAVLAKLETLSGDAFDQAYMRQAGVADHKKVRGMLLKDQSHARDPDVKALAAKMLPTVEQHLNAARQMAAAKGAPKDSKSTASGDAADKTPAGNRRNP